MRAIKLRMPIGETTCDGCPYRTDQFCDLFLDASFGGAGELKNTDTGTFKRLPECLAADAGEE